MPDDMTRPVPAPDVQEGGRRRRRSRYVSTLLLGATALAVTACGDDAPEQEARIFPNVAACVAEFSQEECNQAFEQSRQLHMQTAPKFDTMQACEATVGANACQAVPMAQANGTVSNVFIPALMGFMLARALQQPGPGYGYGGGYVSYGGRSYHARPVYVDREGFVRTGSSQVSRIPGGRDAFINQRTPTTVTTPVNRSGQVGRPSTSTSRGGFGATSSRFSGGGS